MNRITVIFLALAILLAHTLAIHQTPDGTFGAPYEIAHVAFRSARNLVRHDFLSWNPQGLPVESYPSALWIGVCALAEHRYLSPALVTQSLGILCGLGSVVVLTQFSSKRMAGLIAPLLLAASGTAAAAGASGTEAPLAMLVVTTAFLAFEWGWKRVLAVALALLVATRPEGILLAGVFAVLERFDRPVLRTGVRRAPITGWYALPLGVVLAMAFYRHLALGVWLSPFEHAFLSFDAARIRLGGHYLESYFFCGGAAPLLVLPAGLLLWGKLTARGRRALVLSLAWAGAVAWSGGDGLPFWNGLAAVVPLSLLAIQEAITRVMDRRPRFFAAGWTALVLATGMSFLTSKVPSNYGPLPLDEIHRTWMKPCPAMAATYERPLGRLGLLQELREVERLRPLGIFLRDNVKDPSSIATFWPGAVGYLSRKRIYDLLGRAYPSPGCERTVSWRGEKRADLVGAIELDAEYVVPLIGALAEGMTATTFLQSWQDRYDTQGASPERMRELLEALNRYELVSVPVPDHGRDQNVPSTHPFLLLRRKDLGLTPRLEVRLEGREFEVFVHHEGHRQVVDLTVTIAGDRGTVQALRPTGEWTTDDEEISGRTGILLYETGQRPILLMRGILPPGIREGTLRAQLHNPGMRSSAPLSAVGPAVRTEIVGNSR